MHPRNIHNTHYNFKELSKVNPDLENFIIKNQHTNDFTIDFSNPKAVIALNKALLLHHYQLQNWELPEGFLCPPIPSRVDYIHHISDLLSDENQPIKGLDIGVGANAIYTILGVQVYGWEMVGCDINLESVKAAQKNINFTPKLAEKVTIVHQPDSANIFKGIIQPNDYFHFTVCNPPFYTSEEDAAKNAKQKLTNLGKGASELNFGGQHSELWCNGGEALFLKRMIKQSADFKTQVGYYTSLVSKKENLPKIEKQLKKLKANYTIIPMEHGNKKTRFIAWSFIKPFDK
ncbi:23S rRNA (adenine(1618)-N(6))-methyltransferase RlmF [Tenacibaculum sp. MEBiC06402]|uniref:23S rRNA (adenine(1618)-N(6))-methyltransferase RlmF n=1 Tax=unclassified Tenacibaculum TaxID=2635139 RepID=UPI003B9B2951